MSTWTAVPWIEFDGMSMRGGNLGYAWDAVVLAEVSVDYGRGHLLEHSDTGAATVRLLARPAARELLENPLGRELVIGYTASRPGYNLGSEIMFRGRVDSSTLNHFRAEDGEALLEVELSAAGRLAEIARAELPPGAQRGKETAVGRRNYLAGKLPSSVQKAIGGVAGLFPYGVAPQDYDRTSLLAAIQELGDTTAEAIIYDPRRNLVDGMGTWAIYASDTAPVLHLTWDNGLVRVSPGADGTRTYDAGEIDMSSAQVSQHQSIDRVAVVGYIEREDGTFDDGFGQYYTIPTVAPGMSFKVEGLTYYSYKTGADVSRDPSMAAWKQIVTSARQFTHPPISREVHQGWKNYQDLSTDLSGKEVRNTFYVMGSVYSAIGEAVPFCRPIGGSLRYTTNDQGAGYWTTEYTLAPVRLDRALKPITLSQLNPSATSDAVAFTYDDFHGSLSLIDLGNAEKGL